MYRSQLEVLYSIHRVYIYIYKSEVYILISMAPDLQSRKEDHNQNICYFLILLQGNKELREACLRA